MTSNVVQLPAGPKWRVLIAHQRDDVRHVLRTLIEAENVAVIEAADGDVALAKLESLQFDLLVLQLDLPQKDGLTLMQLHRVLLAYERPQADPPAVLLTLAPEVRNNVALTDHLSALGVADFIDDAPRADVAARVDDILQARAARRAGKPAAA
ncbi:MAG TPA: response regulator [Casimicrobiaceae bacterium]|nr:response regulator [Casimicrobiaceae bacterium]